VHLIVSSCHYKCPGVVGLIEGSCRHTVPGVVGMRVRSCHYKCHVVRLIVVHITINALVLVGLIVG
jgi:hypothetical protein